MKIIVCMKQVPGTTKVEIDEETGILKRSGASAKVNPYDLYALETGLKLREQLGGTVTAVTMGPEQAEEMMQEAYMMGIDDAYIFSDRRFAGADVLATAHTLAEGIRTIGPFDLIICGKQTTDGDTSQIGPALAEILQIPHTAWVNRIDEASQDGLRVEWKLRTVTQVVSMKFPCLITVEKGIFTPRLPSYRMKKEKAEARVHRMDLDQFSDSDPRHYGQEGSPTSVERIFPPAENTDYVYLEGDAGEKAAELFRILTEKKFV